MAMPRQKDYYEVLGVPRNASADEIRKAYLKLAHKYHPDKTGGDKAAEDKLKEVNEAYDTLKNPDKRAKYDQFGHLGDQFGAGSGFGAGQGFGGGFGFGGAGGFDAPFDDFFDVLFGRGGAAHRRSAATPGHDLEYRMTVKLQEAALGTKKKIRFARREVCNDCNGTGAAPGTQPQACTDCGGTGQVRRSQGFFSITQTCGRCRGAGRVITSPCGRCTGAGHIRAERNLSVNVPAGVDTGSRIRLSGEGEPGTGGGPRGDLYIFIEVEPDDFFERDGNNIICEVPITFPQAVLGDSIRVPTLHGEENLKIPAGTQSGEVFRIRGMGIRDLRGYHKGDQLVRVHVETPAKLSREERDLVKRLKELGNEKAYPLHRKFLDKLKNLRGGK